MLLKDVLEEFIYECEIRNLSKRTIKNYKNNNNLFQNYLNKEIGIKELEEIESIHIKKYLKYLNSKGLKATYINGILKTIRAFFKYCLKEEYIEINPTCKVSWLKEGKVIINTFNSKEINRMLEAYKFTHYLEARNKMLIALLIDTGARNNELCNILNDDIRDRTILLRGKGNKERHVSISPLLKKYIIRYTRIKDLYFKDKMLLYNNFLLSYTGLPLTPEAVERVVKKAGELADVRKNIRCSPHTVRHWYAQEQLRNGLDVYSLSRLLGHENITITKRYLQSIETQDIVELSVKTSPLMNIKRGGKK